MRNAVNKSAGSSSMPSNSESLITGNYFDKYRSTNRIHRRLVRGFLAAAKSLVLRAAPTSVIEIGAGPGDLAARLFTNAGGPALDYLGTDICDRQVATARERYPQVSFCCASAYELPLPDRSYDLGVACEVLEHLEDPDKALVELARVTRRYVLISVPWEPTWRILNCMRGKYLGRFGNTPGHLQHFTRRKIRQLIAPHFEIIEERRPFPWTMLLLRQR